MRVADAYDEHAEDYDERYHDRLSLAQNSDIRRMLERVISPGDCVLDLGCGTGLIADIFKDTHLIYVGLDASPAMLDIAYDKHPRHKWAWGDLAFADVHPLVRDWRFDVCVSTFAFGYSAMPYRAARAMHNLLLPGGRLFLLTYAPRRFSDPSYLLNGEGVSVNPYGGEYLRRIFETSGFVNCRTYGWSFGTRHVRAERALLGRVVPSLARYTILEATRG